MDNILQIYGRKFYEKMQKMEKNKEGISIAIFLRKRQLMKKREFDYENIKLIHFHPYYLHFVFTFYNGEYFDFKNVLVEGISGVKNSEIFIGNGIFKEVVVSEKNERKKRKMVAYYSIDFDRLNLFIANSLKEKFTQEYFPPAIISQLETGRLNEQLVLYLLTKNLNMYSRRIIIYLYDRGSIEEEQLLVDLLIPKEKYKYHLIELFKLGYIIIGSGRVQFNIKKAIRYYINGLLCESKYCNIENAEMIIFLREYIKIFD